MKKRRKPNNVVTSQQFNSAEVIILGFTGSLGSGCTYISKQLAEELDDGRYFSLSDIINDDFKEMGVRRPSIQLKQDKGNELRKLHGVSVLAERCLEKIDKSFQEKQYNENKTIILVDGIRNDGEIRFFKKLPNFYLFSVHAGEKMRESRLVGKGRKFSSNKAFDIANKRDKEEDIEYGQQVNKCNYLADIIINNENEFFEETDEKKAFFQSLEREYIDRFRQIQKGNIILDHPPKIMETLMTIAYCMSKKSSCNKRKVGAVIAYIIEIKNLKTKRPEDHITMQVISSGFNEVPLGTDPCCLSENQKCQRDYLKEDFSKKFKHCPNCGEKIPINVKKNLKGFSGYQCVNSSCKTNIIKNFLPGSTKRTGKLLDMCRALHAEEIALLGLEGISKQRKNEGKIGKFVLYTTTYPCNLCANKIVASGIDEVVYAEPYTMEEAESILESGKVNIVKFEGVKSSAYFRLYSY